ncbi:MAG: hypothetical protein U0Z44_10550 [Kouleothrix sp.]
MRRLRLLLGDSRELNAEPLSAATLSWPRTLVRRLRRDDVQVRLYTGHTADQPGHRVFRHAKCYLFYGRSNVYA